MKLVSNIVSVWGHGCLHLVPLYHFISVVVVTAFVGHTNTAQLPNVPSADVAKECLVKKADDCTKEQKEAVEFL